MLRARSPHNAASDAARSRASTDPRRRRTSAELNESRALHRVFLDLSDRYHEHCRQTGMAESPELCAAAARYRSGRSLGALLSFADRLDQLGIAASGGERRSPK